MPTGLRLIRESCEDPFPRMTESAAVDEAPRRYAGRCRLPGERPPLARRLLPRGSTMLYIAGPLKFNRRNEIVPGQEARATDEDV